MNSVNLTQSAQRESTEATEKKAAELFARLRARSCPYGWA